MKLGDRGHTIGNTRQQGVIVAVFTNGGIFQSDTGARFTVLLCEFCPDSADEREAWDLRITHSSLFSGIRPGDGFAYTRIATKQGVVREIRVQRIPGPTSPETIRARASLFGGRLFGARTPARIAYDGEQMQ